MIPYGRHTVTEEDIQAVADALRSPMLTCGDRVAEFEDKVADYVGADHAVAVSSGTAALHAAMFALGIGPRDAVIVPAITFVSTANAVRYCGGVPIICDVDPSTLQIDLESAEEGVNWAACCGLKVRAVVPVDYAGVPCDYEAIREFASRYGISVVADAAHSLGGSLKALRVGSLADMTCFSFHPLKTITTAEGGMIVTNDSKFADAMRRFRNIGRNSVADVDVLGYNYRLSDIQCALGISQLKRIGAILAERRAIADRYDAAFHASATIGPVVVPKGRVSSRHLYVVRVESRDRIKASLLTGNIVTQIHYTPVNELPEYRRFLDDTWMRIDTPIAHEQYKHILSLPIYPGLSEIEQDYVISALKEAAS